MDAGMIIGLSLAPLKQIKNPKGNIFHVLKQSEESFTKFGEAYFSSVLFRDIKGWKKHSEMEMNIVVPVGSVKFVCFDDRPGSESHGAFYEVTLSQENYYRLTVPCGIWMAFQGVGSDLNLLLNIASIEHDPVEATNILLDDITYSWSSNG